MLKRNVGLIIALAVGLGGCARAPQLAGGNKAECQEGMASVSGKFCMDVYEYPNVEGYYPTVNVDWKTAKGACEAEGKRLCSTEEWQYACGSGKGQKYPYGNTKQAVCNDSQSFGETENKDKGKVEGTKESNSKRVVYITKEEVGKTINALAVTATGNVSENNRRLLEAVRKLLEIEKMRIELLEVASVISDENGKEAVNLEVQIGKLPMEEEEKKFLISKIKEGSAGVESKTGGKEVSMKDYMAIVNKIIDFEKNEVLYKTGMAESPKKKSEEKGGGESELEELERERLSVMATMVVKDPMVMGKLIRKENEKFSGLMDEIRDNLYKGGIMRLTNEDIAELKNKIVPEIEKNGGNRVGDVVYVIERKLQLDYDLEKKELKYKRADLKIGESKQCKSEQGIYDLIGSVWEWTGSEEKNATYRGGDSSDISGSDFKQCGPIFRNLKIKPADYKYYSIGFRCCK